MWGNAPSLEFVPLLRRQRELYDLPLGRERFQAYLDTMTGGSDEMVLPLTLMNPMAKPSVAARLDAIIGLDAEEVAREALAEARKRLAGLHDRVRVALVLADDAGGGWTNRYLTDCTNRFESRYAVRHGWAVALLWSSELPSSATIRARTLAAVYRTLRERRYGAATTLRSMLEQEGRAEVFAGQVPEYAAAEIDRIREVVDPHGQTTAFPVQFACLYGDEPATSVGYAPFGLPPRAGFALATARALAANDPPEATLLAPVREESF